MYKSAASKAKAMYQLAMLIEVDGVQFKTLKKKTISHAQKVQEQEIIVRHCQILSP